MELWIRNQDKEILLKIDRIGIEEYSDGYGIVTYERIGTKKEFGIGLYKTKERALEVLDEIQNKIAQNQSLISLMNNFTDLKGNEEEIGKLFKDMIYEMPEE